MTSFPEISVSKRRASAKRERGSGVLGGASSAVRKKRLVFPEVSGQPSEAEGRAWSGAVDLCERSLNHSKKA